MVGGSVVFSMGMRKPRRWFRKGEGKGVPGRLGSRSDEGWTAEGRAAGGDGCANARKSTQTQRLAGRPPSLSSVLTQSRGKRWEAVSRMALLPGSVLRLEPLSSRPFMFSFLHLDLTGLGLGLGRIISFLAKFSVTYVSRAGTRYLYLNRSKCCVDR
jgi:hypothetical protein